MAKAPLGTVLALLLCSAAAAQQTVDLTAGLLDPFAFRHIGPIGNRVSAVAGVPGDEGVYYAGAASGGLWRTHNGGASWAPIFDRQEAASIGSIAVAPSDPFAGVLWRSDDRGDSWRLVSRNLDLITRPLYYTRMAAAPDRADELTFVATRLSVSLDGGSTVESEGFDQAGWDHHDIWIDPLDGGETWTDVTANLPDLPPLGTVRNIDPSHFEAGTAYVAIDRRQEGDTNPYVFRTNDYGETWTDLAADLPRGPLGNVHCIREDPEQPGLLYLGAENALWVSFDDGAAWQRLSRRSDGGANLPPAPVHWIEVQEHFDDLVVATYGRGIWILDDATPLRAIARGLSTDGPELLPPRVTYRFRTRGAPMAQPDVPATGTNPPYGPPLHYWIPDPGNAGVSPASGAERRSADARGQIRIFNEQDELVRTLDDLPAAPGLHRVSWDLRHDPTTEVRLRTKPDERPDWKMPAEGWRPLRDGDRLSLLAAPGVYRLELSLPGDAGEESEALSTAEFEVLLDPDSTASADDLAAQNELLFVIRDAIERAASILNGAEDLRAQLPALQERLEDDDAHGAAAEQATALDDELRQIEGAFFDLRLTGTGQDSLRWERRLYARLTYLARSVGQADARPTDQQVAVWRRLQSQLAEQEDRFEATLAGPLADLNQALADGGFLVLDPR